MSGEQSLALVTSKAIARHFLAGSRFRAPRAVSADREDQIARELAAATPEDQEAVLEKWEKIIGQVQYV